MLLFFMLLCFFFVMFGRKRNRYKFKFLFFCMLLICAAYIYVAFCYAFLEMEDFFFVKRVVYVLNSRNNNNNNQTHRVWKVTTTEPSPGGWFYGALPSPVPNVCFPFLCIFILFCIVNILPILPLSEREEWEKPLPNCPPFNPRKKKFQQKITDKKKPLK